MPTAPISGFVCMYVRPYVRPAQLGIGQASWDVLSMYIKAPLASHWVSSDVDFDQIPYGTMLVCIRSPTP